MLRSLFGLWLAHFGLSALDTTEVLAADCAVLRVTKVYDRQRPQTYRPLGCSSADCFWRRACLDQFKEISKFGQRRIDHNRGMMPKRLEPTPAALPELFGSE